MDSLRGPLALIILDGWGVRSGTSGNAILAAKTPEMDRLLKDYPHTTLVSSGEDVGLPRGQMGNSEVGHLNIGAGRVVYQELTRISKAVRDGDFFQNEVLLGAVQQAKSKNSSLHLMGLLSDGGVHSHITHLFALLDLAERHGLSKVFIHCFLDGRDVPPASALEYIEQLEEKLSQTGVGRVASVMGRYYAMDRDRRWERTREAYLAMVSGQGLRVPNPAHAVEESYRWGEKDEFVRPALVEIDGEVAKIKQDDAVIFFNFRPDRARQITRAFVDREFEGFERPQDSPTGLYFVCMTQYDKTINAPVAFKPVRLNNTLGEVLALHGIQQLRLAETEKYAHVTFFFNGGVEAPSQGEDRVLVPSPRVATYDLEPEMSAMEVTEKLLQVLNLEKYKVIIMNYANPDMVGHTGYMEATVKAVETVDTCLGRAVRAVLDRGGAALVTADHGNAEQMLDEDGQPFTAHTTNPVPFILVARDARGTKLISGRLEDIAPTMLDMLKVEMPREMTGHTLIQHLD